MMYEDEVLDSEDAGLLDDEDLDEDDEDAVDDDAPVIPEEEEEV